MLKRRAGGGKRTRVGKSFALQFGHIVKRLLGLKERGNFMIYKNIEVFNAVEAEEYEGGMRFYRVPESVSDAMEIPPGGVGRATNSTGVELRFVVKSGTVKIKIKDVSPIDYLSSFHVYYGGLQGGWDAHEVNCYITREEKEFEFKTPPNLEKLRKISKEAGIDFDPSVVRVIFDRGSYVITDVSGDAEPPTKDLLPQKTLLCYGSSITHGSNSIDMSHSWASILGHNINMDVRNLGMAGACAAEEEMVGYIASEGERGAWDTAVLSLGINILNWEEEKIYARVKNMIAEIAGRNRDKKVFVISPLYNNDDYENGGRSDNWRKIIASECEKAALPNVTYINGLDLLGSMDLISADFVHPNIYGVSQIAERLTKIVKDSLQI